MAVTGVVKARLGRPAADGLRTGSVLMNDMVCKSSTWPDETINVRRLRAAWIDESSSAQRAQRGSWRGENATAQKVGWRPYMTGNFVGQGELAGLYRRRSRLHNPSTTRPRADTQETKTNKPDPS